MFEDRLEEWYNSLGEEKYSRREVLRNGSRVTIGGLGGIGLGIYLDEKRDGGDGPCEHKRGNQTYVNNTRLGIESCERVGGYPGVSDE